MKKTVAFFEGKGLALKADDHERVWYSDFLKFQKDNRIRHADGPRRLRRRRYPV